MIQPQADTGSFRDPGGRVYRLAGEVFRTVSEKAIGDYEFARKTGLLDDLMAEGKLVPTEEVDSNVLGEVGAKATRVLRHQRIPFISYPYEWPFSLLKAAALLHLDIQIEALRVEPVVRRHHRPRVGAGDGQLERREVDLAQGALVDDGVDDHPVGLLVVDREVLQARADPEDWMPSMVAVASSPDRSGSSAKYSKLRPRRGGA